MLDQLALTTGSQVDDHTLPKQIPQVTGSWQAIEGVKLSDAECELMGAVKGVELGDAECESMGGCKRVELGDAECESMGAVKGVELGGVE